LLGNEAPASSIRRRGLSGVVLEEAPAGGWFHPRSRIRRNANAWPEVCF
jgi:hypothetical protein